MCYDLFGEIPVTEDDVYLWVRAVSPRWLSPEKSYRNYVRTYDVAGKIRQAKLVGTFDTIVAHPVPQYHARLALHSII